MAAPPGLAPKVLQRPPRPPTHRGLELAPTAGYAHTRTLLRRSRSVGGAPLGGIPPISFLAPYGFTRPLTRTHRVIPPDLGSRSERLSAKGSWSPNARRAVAATTKRVELQPPLAATSVDVDSHLGQPRARGAREASIRPATTARPVIEARCEGGDAMRDAQADVPSA
ncbi:hypothetical protein BC332_34648 [Capsicum chinense]|nr:hypothetical protein BC332_34648 [Capsicum chinense]